MVRKVFNVWILIVLVALPGCEETRQKPARASIEGIKLADLQPAQFDKFPPQISFNVFTFDLLTEKFALIEEMFELLTKQPLNFTSKNAFLANGFEAGFGHPDAWNQIAIRLNQAGARKANTHSLLFLDDNPNDVFVGLRQTNQVVTYTDSNAKPRKTEVMPGAFVWRIKARSNDQLRGTADVEIQPVFQQNTGGLAAHINEGEQTGAIVFDSAVQVWHDIGSVVTSTLLLPVLAIHLPPPWKPSERGAVAAMVSAAAISSAWILFRDSGGYPLGVEPMFPALLTAALCLVADGIHYRT